MTFGPPDHNGLPKRPKRPTRTVRRETSVTHRGRPLVILVPPTADIILIREKGRRTVYEVPALAMFSVGAKLAAAKLRADRAAKRKGRR
jgi:hypothetical protein